MPKVTVQILKPKFLHPEAHTLCASSSSAHLVPSPVNLTKKLSDRFFRVQPDELSTP